MQFMFPLESFSTHPSPAVTEGWDVFDVCGEARILKDDEAEEFENDHEAIEFVVGRAAAGDKRALLALFLDGQDNQEGLDIPDCLIGELNVETKRV